MSLGVRFFSLFLPWIFGYTTGALDLGFTFMKHRVRTPKSGHVGADFFHVLIKIKLIAIEVAATIVFFVWLYRELLHELRRWVHHQLLRHAGFSKLHLRLLFAMMVAMGEMRRVIAQEQRERQTTDRYASTLVIASAIIAAVRLSREDISTPSPRLTSAIGDSITLARMILRRVTGQ
jgi:hypothetical protein